MENEGANIVNEPQALFGFTSPNVVTTHTVSKGGDDSFSVEPKRGRDVEKVRSLGQVATPRALATVMASWVVAGRPAEILDPAAGLGNLLNACRTLAASPKLEGIEIDPVIAEQANRTTPKGTRLICGDYLKMQVRPRSGIVANPPYIKAARLDLRPSDWEHLEDLLDCPLDRLTNAYVLFLLKIWRDLAPGGRAAVLIPGEFLNANYGVPIKARLLKHIRPVATLVLDPALNLFDTALTTSTLLLLEKAERVCAVTPAYFVRRLGDLQPLVDDLISANGDPRLLTTSSVDVSGFLPSEKWLNRIMGLHEEHEAFTHRLGDFFRCSRGIATGANDYFCLRPSDIAAHGLAARDFLPCVTKAPDFSGLVFDSEAHARLQTDDKRCWLLAPQTPDVAMRHYLAAGESAGVAAKFLPSHRPVWYLPENRAPAQAWIAVFSRDTLKCVLNETDTRHLTCFHGIYARPGSSADPARLVLFLNSSLGRIAIRQAQRFYGSGLNKLEPKDVEAIPCPSLAATPAMASRRLIASLKEIECMPILDQPAALDTLAEKTFGLTTQAVA